MYSILLIQKVREREDGVRGGLLEYGGKYYVIV